jgi:hypothetical protein
LYLLDFATAGTTIAQNAIHSLSNGNASAAVLVTGLYYAGATTGTNVIGRNFIHSLSNGSSSGTAAITGIHVNGGVSVFQNNMIRLGIDAGGEALTNGIILVGIDKTTSSNNNFYHNNIYIGGSGVVSGTTNTLAFRRTFSN